MRVKEESEKVGLKHSMKNTKIMASSSITSWQIDGKKWWVTDFIFLGSKTTVDSDHSHKIKRCLLLRGKAMINLDSILKSRHITLLTKVHGVKAIIFPIVMYICESWTIKKAEHQKIAAFKKTFESPLDNEEIKPVNPKGNKPWVFIEIPIEFTGASLVAQTVKHLSAMLETQVRSLGWEDPLEKEMATHSSILAWIIPWTEEPGRL